MRIKVDINNPNNNENLGALQTMIEANADNHENYFVATDKETALPFRFVYSYMLGCHRFFIYDPIDGELLSFFAEDFTDIGGWILEKCDKYFCCNYEILINA